MNRRGEICCPEGKRLPTGLRHDQGGDRAKKIAGLLRIKRLQNAMNQTRIVVAKKQLLAVRPLHHIEFTQMAVQLTKGLARLFVGSFLIQHKRADLNRKQVLDRFFDVLAKRLQSPEVRPNVCQFRSQSTRKKTVELNTNVPR